MKREEFLAELEKNLKSQSKEEIAKIISDFDEFFQEGAISSKTEEEICRTLGNPAEIAEQLNQEASIFEAKAMDAGAIYVSLYSYHLVCSSYAGDQIDVKVMLRDKVIEDESINISRTGLGMEINQFRPVSVVKRFLDVFEDKKVVIRIPRNFEGNMHLKVAHGHISLEEVEGKSICADAIAGNIRFSRVSVQENIQIDCISGNICLKNCKGELTVHGKSGNIEIQSHQGSISAAVISGNICAETDQIRQPGKIQTKSGNIKLILDALQADLDVHNTSGNISLTANMLSGNITADTRSGNIRAFLKSDIKAFFVLQSSEIKNEFQNDSSAVCGLPVVTLSTCSGDIKVKKL